MRAREPGSIAPPARRVFALALALALSHLARSESTSRSLPPRSLAAPSLSVALELQAAVRTACSHHRLDAPRRPSPRRRTSSRQLAAFASFCSFGFVRAVATRFCCPSSSAAEWWPCEEPASRDRSGSGSCAAPLLSSLAGSFCSLAHRPSIASLALPTCWKAALKPPRSRAGHELRDQRSPRALHSSGRGAWINDHALAPSRSSRFRPTFLPRCSASSTTSLRTARSPGRRTLRQQELVEREKARRSTARTSRLRTCMLEFPHLRRGTTRRRFPPVSDGAAWPLRGRSGRSSCTSRRSVRSTASRSQFRGFHFARRQALDVSAAFEPKGDASRSSGAARAGWAGARPAPAGRTFPARQGEPTSSSSPWAST